MLSPYTGRRRALFLGVFTIIIYLYTNPFRLLSKSMPQRPIQDHPLLSKEAFVSAATQNARDYYNARALERFCAHDLWVTHKVINCDRIFGGIGNIRQRILACVSHAMKEGLGFIIPPLSLRNHEDLSVLEADGFTTFDYAFDRDLFIHRVTSSCPRMAIYESLEVAEQSGLEIVRFPPTMAQQSICDDPFDFAINIGHILAFPPTIYRLAYTALYTLSLDEKLSISTTPIDSLSSSYLAIHLRTATDAIAMGWSNYEIQSKRYLELASARAIPVIYVASGNATSVVLFAREAALLTPPVMVVTKEDVLSGADLAELQALSWDQAALVDYVLSESAGFFAGITESSFSWNIAMKRAAIAGGSNAVCGENSGISQNMAWEDNWSLIYGNHSANFEGRIWP